jgi:hypothetical protein
MPVCSGRAGRGRPYAGRATSQPAGRLIHGDDAVAERREWRGDTTGPASKLQDLAVGREALVDKGRVDQRRFLSPGSSR